MPLKGLKLRIYPNQQQEHRILANFGYTRFVWNQMLAMLNERYKNSPQAPFLNAYALNNLLPTLKRENPWLKDAESTSLQSTNHDLVDAFKRFFRRDGGYPKFKSKKRFKQAYTAKCVNRNIQPVGMHFVKLPKLGIVRFKTGRPIPEKIKAVTLKRTPTGKYYAVLLVEGENQAFARTGRTIGYDLGVADLLIGSDGTRFPTLRFDKWLAHKQHVWEKRLARRRQLAGKAIAWDRHQQVPVPRTLADFKNVQKARLMVAKYKEKVANQRANYLHQLTTYLVKTHDRIALEDLKTKNLMHRHTLARAIANQAWGEIRRLLTYKCEWYGKELVLVSPYKTSQICSVCGHEDGKKPLYVRAWTCPQCGTHHDRDQNAATNIKQLAFA